MVGGLYGNVEALDAVLAIAAREPGPVDARLQRRLPLVRRRPAATSGASRRKCSRHAALRGNVETEIAARRLRARAAAAPIPPTWATPTSRARTRSSRGCARPRARLPALRARLGAPADASRGAGGGGARRASCTATAPRSPAGASRRTPSTTRATRRWIESAFRATRASTCSRAATPACRPLRAFDFAHGRAVVAQQRRRGHAQLRGRRASGSSRASRVHRAPGTRSTARAVARRASSTRSPCATTSARWQAALPRELARGLARPPRPISAASPTARASRAPCALPGRGLAPPASRQRPSREPPMKSASSSCSSSSPRSSPRIFAFDLGRFLSLDYFKAQQAAIDAYFRAQPAADGRDLLRASTSR